MASVDGVSVSVRVSQYERADIPNVSRLDVVRLMRPVAGDLPLSSLPSENPTRSSVGSTSGDADR